jgi:hypothetical protein
MGLALLVTTPIDVGAIIQGAVDTLSGVLNTVAPIVVGLGATIVGLMFGWKLFKRFIH